MTNIGKNEIIGDKLLVLLEQQTDNFITLKEYINARNIKPSTVFLPQTLKKIAEDLSVNDSIIFEAINYLDVVKFYSTILYNDPEVFISNICSIIVEDRTVNDVRKVINQSSMDDFIFNTKEEANEFLLNNKVLIAIYLFSLVNLIFYKQP